MWNKPSKEELSKLPRLNETDHVDCRDKVIHMHFSIGRCDWYAAEFDGKDRFFGFVNLNDPMNAEWGYFLLSELDNTNVEGVEVERDLLWQPKKFSEISQKGIGVVHEYFTEQEAQAKIGKVIETLVEFSSVPKGTAGTVVRADRGMTKARWTVGIQWLLTPPKPSVALAQIGTEQFIMVESGKPLIDWFTKAEYEEYLKEL